MPAWKHLRTWDSATEAEFGMCCATWYVDRSYPELDCADLALKLVVDFAAARGLPVVLAGSASLFDSRAHAGTVGSYLFLAQRAVGTAHLRLPTNTRYVGQGAGVVRPGRLLLHLTRGLPTHVQVATRVSRDRDWVSIVQGNEWQDTQAGTAPQTGSYRPGPTGSGGTYVRNGLPGGAGDLWPAIEVRAWNFSGWNRT